MVLVIFFSISFQVSALEGDINNDGCVNNLDINNDLNLLLQEKLSGGFEELNSFVWSLFDNWNTCVEPPSGCRASVDFIDELPRDEEQLRFLFEVLLDHGETARSDAEGRSTFMPRLYGVTRWDAEDCKIPIFFSEETWGRPGTNDVKERISEGILLLTDNVYETVILNDNPGLLEQYGDRKITINVGNPRGYIDEVHEQVGEWQGIAIHRGYVIESAVVDLSQRYFDTEEESWRFSDINTIFHELGHALGYKHSWQLNSHMSQVGINYVSRGYPGLIEQDILPFSDIYKLYYRIPIGTSPLEIYNRLEIDELPFDILDGAPYIVDSREIRESNGRLYPTADQKTEYRPGEELMLVGRRFTQASSCSTLSEDRPNTIPTVQIGNLMIRLELDERLTSHACIEIPVTIPEDISPGRKEVKVHVRGKVSNSHYITILE